VKHVTLPLSAFLSLSLFAAMGSTNKIIQEQSGVVAEGTGISLSCEYDGSIYSIQWYRHQQKSRPEFLLYITEGGSIHPIRSDFSARINKTQKRVDLLISSAAATDSAVYYCAVRPTVTGNSKSV
uniref:Ig-like domain-containing protein n=1 Tax=Nothobranchius furzeri TaxID=105023 RepID=A0A8C6NU97_NOTFU